VSRLVGFCLLLACLLASAGVSHAESNWRVLASAGRSFVSIDGEPAAGLDVGAGIENVANPVARLSLRFDLHGFGKEHGSWHTLTELLCLRFMLVPEDQPVRPYLWGGAGYGTAISVSDFILPVASAAAVGVELTEHGRTWFLEGGSTWAHDERMIALRVGASLR